MAAATAHWCARTHVGGAEAFVKVFFFTRAVKRRRIINAAGPSKPSGGPGLALDVRRPGACSASEVAVAELQINKLLIGLLGVKWKTREPGEQQAGWGAQGLGAKPQ